MHRRGSGESDRETGARTGFSDQLDGAAVRFDERGDDGQAEARAAACRSPRFVGAEEAIEDVRGDLGGHPGAVVGDGEYGVAAGGVECDSHDASRGVQIGVDQQIDDDLTECIGIADHLDVTLGDGAVDALLGVGHAVVADGVVDDSDEVDLA